MDNFLQEHHIVHSPLTAHEDIFNGSPASDVANMKYWNRATFVVLKSTGAVGTATITIESCDNNTPTTPTAVAFKYRKCTTIDTFGAWTDVASTGVVITAGANQVWEATITGDELYSTDTFVRMQLTEDDSTAVDGAILCIMTEPRYGKSIPDTVLA